jgi:hypothetical protein
MAIHSINYKVFRHCLSNIKFFASPLTQLEYLVKGWDYEDLDRNVYPELGRAFRELQQCGFSIIENFYDTDMCIKIREQIDLLMQIHPNFVWRDKVESDERLFGAEVSSDAIRQFSENKHLTAIATAYCGKPMSCVFTLANRVRPQTGNLGSGGGWHRDSFGRQFKALLYLVDVDKHTGPFQLIAGSERLEQLCRDLRVGGIGYKQNRLSEENVRRIIDANPERLQTIVASAGTLLLVNTAAIHRGTPIMKGVRYALTNYYYESHLLSSRIYDHFKPVLGYHKFYSS